MICVIVELLVLGASLVAQMVKRNLPAMQETWVQFLGQKDYLEKGMATHSSILENSMDRGAWQATVHGVAKSWTQLSNRHTHTASLLFLHIFYQRVDMVTPSSLRSGEYPRLSCGRPGFPIREATRPLGFPGSSAGTESVQHFRLNHELNSSISYYLTLKIFPKQ